MRITESWLLRRALSSGKGRNYSVYDQGKQMKKWLIAEREHTAVLENQWNDLLAVSRQADKLNREMYGATDSLIVRCAPNGGTEP